MSIEPTSAFNGPAINRVEVATGVLVAASAFLNRSVSASHAPQVVVVLLGAPRPRNALGSGLWWPDRAEALIDNSSAETAGFLSHGRHHGWFSGIARCSCSAIACSYVGGSHSSQSQFSGCVIQTGWPYVSWARSR